MLDTLLAGAEDLSAEYFELLCLRAIAQLSPRTVVSAAKVARELGVESRDVRDVIERLERDGYVIRWHGFHVSARATAAFGTALWVCTGCGCTDEHGCNPPCWWASEQLCSTCATTTEGGPSPCMP